MSRALITQNCYDCLFSGDGGGGTIYISQLQLLNEITHLNGAR